MNAAIQRYVTSLRDVAVTLLSQEAELHGEVTGIFWAVGPHCTPHAHHAGLFSRGLAPRRKVDAAELRERSDIDRKEERWMLLGRSRVAPSPAHLAAPNQRPAAT